MDDLREEHEFIWAVIKSDLAVCAVARMLRLKGYTVKLPPISVDGTPDEGDIVASRNGIVTRYEVKWFDFDFDSVDDFLARNPAFKLIIVDACYHYDSLNPKPNAYFIANRRLTHALGIKTSTFPKWQKLEGGSSKPGMVGKRLTYRAPRECWADVPLDPYAITNVPYPPGEAPDWTDFWPEGAHG